MDTVADFDRWIAALGRMSHAQSIVDEVRRLRDVARPRCGNCFNWMKTSLCPREAFSRDKGGRPSMNGLSCSKFVEEGRVQEYRDKAEELMKKAKRVAEGSEA